MAKEVDKVIVQANVCIVLAEVLFNLREIAKASNIDWEGVEVACKAAERNPTKGDS